MAVPTYYANDLIVRALRTLGVLTADRPNPDPTDQADGFVALNDMLDAWAAKRLTIFTVARNVYPLAGGKGSPSNPYTIGPGGNFDQVRPIWIPNAELLLTTSTPPLERPLHVLTDDEWARTGVKSLSASLCSDLYYDSAFVQTGGSAGLGNLFLYPVPDGSQPLSVVLYTPLPLTQFADLATTKYAFPPGYVEALRYQLAKRLAPEYRLSLSPEAADLAASTFGLIQQTNNRVPHLRCDPGIVNIGRSGTYNWRTGDYSGPR